MSLIVFSIDYLASIHHNRIAADSVSPEVFRGAGFTADLGPVYMEVGTPGRRGSPPSRGRKMARVYMQTYNPGVPG